MNNKEKQNASQGTQKVIPSYVSHKSYNTSGTGGNLIDSWRVLIEFKKLVIWVTLFFTVVSIVVALLMTPIFHAEVLLAPIKEEKRGNVLGQFGGLASMVGVDVGGDKSTEHSLAVLKSRSFLEDFFKEEMLLPILFSEIWNKSTERWLVDNDEDIPSIWDAYELFTETVLRCSIDKKSGLVTVSIEWKDPVFAAKWANKLVARLNKKLRTIAVAEAENSINYLQEQLQKTSVVDMHQVLYRLIESETQKIMLAKVRDQYAFKVIDPAVIAEEKIKPNRILIIILGLLSGAMFSIFLAFLLKSIANQQREAEKF